MDSSAPNSRPPLIHFSVAPRPSSSIPSSSTSRDDEDENGDHHQKQRSVMTEMNLFPFRKDHQRGSERSGERAHEQEGDYRMVLVDRGKVNTGLNLLTLGDGDGEQTGLEEEEAAAADTELHRCITQQLASTLADNERLKSEIQHLRHALNIWKSEYDDLNARYVTAMQEQEQRRVQNNHRHDKDDRSSIVVPSIRQLIMEPPLSPLAVGSSTTEQPPLSPLAVGSSSGSSVMGLRLTQLGPQHGPGRDIGFRDDGGVGSSTDNSPRNAGRSADHHQEGIEATMRRARVAVRARSEAAMISDGCQWRKYGQKRAKGNPCPRAYFKCTMANTCPVRKQVQRDAEDEGVTVTTYEGTHNHPLPPAAYTMASMTQSAMRSLLSGPMPSPDVLMKTNGLAGPFFPSPPNNNPPFCVASISASAPFPTVTLDLTTQPPPPQQFPMMPSNFQVPLLTQILGPAQYNQQSRFSGLQMSSNQEVMMGREGASSSSNNPVQAQAQAQQGQTSQLSIDAVNALVSDPRVVAALIAALGSNVENENNATPSNNMQHQQQQ